MSRVGRFVGTFLTCIALCTPPLAGGIAAWLAIDFDVTRAGAAVIGFVSGLVTLALLETFDAYWRF